MWKKDFKTNVHGKESSVVNGAEEREKKSNTARRVFCLSLLASASVFVFFTVNKLSNNNGRIEELLWSNFYYIIMN